MRKLALLAAPLALSASAAACSGGGNVATAASTSASHAASTAATAVASTAVASSSSTSGAGGAGTGGAAAGGAGGCSSVPATTTFVPGPADIQFQALGVLPQGEQIAFNDWNPSPNTLSSMTPDGATTTPVLAAYRVWSLGVSHDAATIAFACGDPLQQQHYGLSLGDAVQHTWLYDVAAQKASLLTDGNLNDECHTFGPGDTSLYICRRYDFTGCFDNRGYRIGRIDLPGGAFTFLSPDDPNLQALDPRPSGDGATLYFDETTVAKMTRDILSMALPMGTPATLRMGAGTPALSPDGTRYVYADDGDGRVLHVSNLDGTGDVRVTDVPGDSPAWSPDGTKIAYLFMDSAANCSHVEVVAADGSTSTMPARIRDCSTTHEFITQVAWFVRP